MRMQFVALLITLLSFEASKAEQGACNPAIDVSCKCGQRFSSVVALTNPEFKRTFCGGSIINYKQVLTLAQCVASRNPRDFKVVVKLLNGEPETLYDVESIEFHTIDHHAGRDIAIVNIVQPFSEKASAGTVCLPFCYPGLYRGRGFRTMGWYYDPDEMRNIMTSELVSLNLVDGCVYDDEYLRNNTACIDEQNIDKYDGGEPVYWEIYDQVQLQIGIILPRISRDGDKLTVVIRIGPFVKWIESQVPEGYSYCKYV